MPPKPPARRASTRRTDNEGESSTGAAGEAGEASTRTNTSGTASSPPRTRHTQPTPTPTPSTSTSTPRPPVQRLQSLKKRPPGGALILPNPDGSTPKPTLKYQPRAVARRSKEEREAREKVEAERQRERAAEAAAIQRAAERERGGERGRGRGRGTGVGGRGGLNAGGIDGPASRGFGDRTRGGGSGGGGGGGGGGSGRSGGPGAVGRLKREYGGSGGRKDTRATTMVRSRDGSRVISRDVSSDEGEDTAPRVNIENINVVSDSEGESDEPYGGKGKGKAKGKQRAGADIAAGRGLRPVRVERHEHVERAVAVNTEADSSRSAELRRKAKEAAAEDGDDDLFVRDDEDEPTMQAAGETNAEPRIKEEPTDGDVVMGDDIPHAREVEPTTTGDAVPPPPKDPQTKLPKETGPKNQRRHGQDDIEWERQHREIEMLKTTLGSIDLQPKPPTDEEGQEPKAEPEQAINPRDGRLFLIQFPPKTPHLNIPNDLTQEGAPEVPPQPTASSPPAPTGGIGIKKEERESTTETPIATPANGGKSSNYATATNNSLPAGRVGKLNLHKSGRVTMDWGGIPFELNMGTQVDFLQDAVATSSPTTDLTKEEAEEEKKVWAMSQVTGKFVVTPDWDSLLGE